jgi:hypothetical protein
MNDYKPLGPGRLGYGVINVPSQRRLTLWLLLRRLFNKRQREELRAILLLMDENQMTSLAGTDGHRQAS